MEKIHTEEFFFHTSDQILRGLKENETYRSLYKEVEKLYTDCPVIEKLFYGSYSRTER